MKDGQLERKRAWELVHSKIWTEWLKGYLEERAKPKALKRMTGLDDAFLHQADVVQRETYRQLIAIVEKFAKEHER